MKLKELYSKMAPTVYKKGFPIFSITFLRYRNAIIAAETQLIRMSKCTTEWKTVSKIFIRKFSISIYLEWKEIIITYMVTESRKME